MALADVAVVELDLSALKRRAFNGGLCRVELGATADGPLGIETERLRVVNEVNAKSLIEKAFVG